MINQRALTKRVWSFLSRGEGCRVGEASVVSRKVHTYYAHEPQKIRVIRNSDAGKIFYGRHSTDEVIHMDTFHSLGRIPVRIVAEGVRKAIDDFTRHMAAETGYEKFYRLIHYIDLQTGEGGGRASGRLVYGQKASLKRNHENHVHLTAMLDQRYFGLIPWLLYHVEQSIIASGHELRRIDALLNDVADPGAKQDLTPYSSASDSFLLQQKHPQGLSDEELYRYQLHNISDIMEEIEDISSLEQLMRKAHPRINSRGTPAPSELGSLFSFQPRLTDVWSKLVGYGYAERIGDRHVLTEKGMHFVDRLPRWGRQIECDLRYRVQLPGMKTMTGAKGLGGKRFPGKSQRSRINVAARKYAAEGSLALVPTIIDSLQKSSRQGNEWAIERSNFQYEQTRERPRLDVCLLIDASASMMGKRMKAAKALAEHLVQQSDDRIAVMVFQENKVEIAVPFTRNQTLLKAGLSSIHPAGLTPLASGLQQAAQYVKSNSSHAKALVVVITDGIPTMSEHGGDPFAEALQAARSMGEQGINLCSVGLKPNHRLMERLAKDAGGSVYIIDEITEADLKRVVEAERKELMKQQAHT